MSAIQTMKQELEKISAAMNECVTEEGVVRSCMRYRYQLLVCQAQAFRESIKWMESQIYAKA